MPALAQSTTHSYQNPCPPSHVHVLFPFPTAPPSRQGPHPCRKTPTPTPPNAAPATWRNARAWPNSAWNWPKPHRRRRCAICSRSHAREPPPTTPNRSRRAAPSSSTCSRSSRATSAKPSCSKHAWPPPAPTTGPRRPRWPHPPR